MKIRRSPGIGKKLTAVVLTAAILVCTVVQDGLNTADGNRRTAGLKDPEELERLYEELNADPEEVPGCRTESGRLAETLEERYAGIQEVLAQGNREERKDAAAGFRKEISGARESVEQEIDRIRQMDFMESPVLKERMEQWQQSMDEQFCELDENLKLIEQTGDEEAQEAIGRQLCSEKPEEALSDQPAVPNVRYAAETEDFTGMPKEAQEQGDALDFPEEELLAVPADLKEQFAANLETAELGSALEIYNYVKTQITFDAYYGARKGAEGTLAQKSGNDYDQAGLLVALLRANGIPAYYVRGEMLLSPEQAQEWTAAADAMAAVSQLAAQGIPVTALTAGGRIAAVRMERVWVKALVPYENYRGAGENNGEKVWIALDPAFKKSVWHTGTDISSLTGADELIDELENIHWPVITAYPGSITENCLKYWPGQTALCRITHKSMD